MMLIKRVVKVFVLGGLMLLPIVVSAQMSSSSLNSFSPYTMYGIGELSRSGTANIRTMGGAGVAYRDNMYISPFSFSINSLNPASYSAIPRQSAIFNVEIEGGMTYMKDSNVKGSYTLFNLRDVGLMIPLAKKVGFAVTMAPYSSVGYYMHREIKDENLIANVGYVRSIHEGDGDIALAKAGVGAEIFKGFSIGAELLYYFGYIDRKEILAFEPLIGSGFTNAEGSLSQNISKLGFGAGVQYSIPLKKNRALSFGATYKMGMKLNASQKYYLPSNDAYGDTVFFSKVTTDLELPDDIKVGASFRSRRVVASLDYSFANWGSKNGKMATIDAKYRNTSGVNIGVEYTPDLFSSRSVFHRLSYRFGVRYAENYMMYSGNNPGNYKSFADKSVSFGVGIPIKLGRPTAINVGIEYGQSGTLKQGMVKADYFRLSLGISLFGDDYWFHRRKYN